MAGVTGQRLRLTTTRKPKYRRGGLVIGTAAAPTFIEQSYVNPEQGLALLRDPNITVAIEDEDGEVRTLTAEERAELEEGLRFAIDLDLDEPAPPASAPASEPAQPEPAQPEQAAPEPTPTPSASPPPAPRQRSKAKGSAA